MGTSALHERGVMGRKTGEEGKAKLLVAYFFVPFSSLLSPPLSSIINSNIPQKSDRERLGTRQPKCYPAKDLARHVHGVQVTCVEKGLRGSRVLL